MAKINSRDTIFLFLIFSFLALFFSLKGLTTELYFNGDEPRHAMNGVFIYDFFKDGGWSNPIKYAADYYKQYPALSGHLTQPILYLWEALFFVLFGVSAFSAKLSIVVLTFLGLGIYYFAIKKQINTLAAICTIFLLATNHYFLNFTTRVMSEMPGVCAILILLAVFLRGKKWFKRIIFICIGMLPFILNYKLFFLLPCLLHYFVLRNKMNWKSFSITSIGILAALYLLIFIIISIPLPVVIQRVYHLEYLKKFSNVEWLLSGANISAYFKSILHILTPIGFILAIVSIFGMKSQKLENKQILLFAYLVIFWNFLVFAFFGAWPIQRLLIYSLPFFMLLVGITIAQLLEYKSIWAKFFAGFIIAILIGFNINSSYNHQHFKRGYLNAAKFVNEINIDRQPILVDARNNGAIIFYTRTLDPTQKTKMIRSGKILQNVILEEAIIKLLDEEGIRYIISGTGDFGFKWQNAFRSLMSYKKKKFKLLKIFNIESDLEPSSKIKIYEYLDHKPREQASHPIWISRLNRSI